MRPRPPLAGAPIHGPSALLLDEPFDGLDAPATAALTAQLQDSAVRSGRAVPLATHRADLALSACDRIAVLHRGKLLRIPARGEVEAAGLAGDLRRLGRRP